MSTRRARKHQRLVHKQKAFRYLKRQRDSYRTEHLGLLYFVPADWSEQKQYSEIAENLYKTGPVSVDFTPNLELVKKLWEALEDD